MDSMGMDSVGEVLRLLGAEDSIVAGGKESVRLLWPWHGSMKLLWLLRRVVA